MISRCQADIKKAIGSVMDAAPSVLEIQFSESYGDPEAIVFWTIVFWKL